MSAEQILKQVRSHPGVLAADYDKQSSTLTLRYDGEQTNVAAIEALAHRMGARLRIQAAPAMLPEEVKLATLPWMIRLTALCLLMVVLGWTLDTLTELPRLVIWAFYAVAYISGGFYTVQDAWRTLMERKFDVNFLMVIAALGAALVGQPLEGAVLMFLFSLSNTLETYAMGRTHASIRALLDMTPQEADVYRGDTVRRVPVEELQVGDLALVRPGAQMPADGVVVKGNSAVNEASITGESMPTEKQPGSRVFAGTLNGQGALDIQITTAVEDSTLARIVQVVREARLQKAQSQDFTDRVIGQYYAYAVVAITLVAIIVPLVFLGWDLSTTLYRAMTLMVVASPCALVISIPAALLSAMATAGRQGVLFKGGRYLESAAQVKVVALDKTGTLTVGRPSVVAIMPFDDWRHLPFELPPRASLVQTPANEPVDPLTDKQMQLLALAAAVDHDSEHPLARAIVKCAQEYGIPLPMAHDFESLTGLGARATVAGRALRVGRPSMFGSLTPEVAATVATQQQLGRTVIMIGDEQPYGLIAVADTVRSEAHAAIVQLRAIGIERIVLLTGDNAGVANAVGKELGIDEVHAELLPGQKVDAIKELEARYGPVAMVGDGINDAPALATATLGVAMGVAGSDVALESADMLLVSDNLSRLPDAFNLARRTRAIVRQNLAFAFGVMATLMILALFGSIPLPVGVIGHEGSTLIVVANSLRLLVRRM